jgi:hypothetical protein
MPPKAGALAGVVELLPKEYATDGLRKKFSKLERHLDGLLFLDHTAELAVDREAFLALCADAELVPAEIHDIVILETAKHLGRRLKGFETKGRRLTWREGEKYGLLGHSSVQELLDFGYTPTMSQAKLRAALPKWYPGLVPEKAISQLGGRDPYRRMIRRAQHNRTWWDCIVANLGWFAAINIIGSHIILFMLLAAGVPGWVIFAALLAFSGAFTAYTMIQCAINQEFHF